jgi:hypothetical protein
MAAAARLFDKALCGISVGIAIFIPPKTFARTQKVAAFHPTTSPCRNINLRIMGKKLHVDIIYLAYTRRCSQVCLPPAFHKSD